VISASVSGCLKMSRASMAMPFRASNSRARLHVVQPRFS
jgi:hypothetical protein